MMNRLFSSECDVAGDADLRQVLSDVKDEGDVTFKNYCALFSAGQLRLAKAIAIEDIVEKPFEQKFMANHGLTAVSSVRQALKTLT